jgi:tetratricopeptide (TPR) repeat protein
MKTLSKDSGKYIIACAGFLALLAFCGCSTKKNHFISRSYHNLTSRYNGYYYAGEIIKENVIKIEKEKVDDYSKILPLFIYPDEKSAKQYFPEFDKAIKKTSLVIRRHTITDKKGREIPGAVKWIDNNYMVMGKAHFYKRDFFSALETFDYVAKTYKKDRSRYEAALWLIRTYNENGSLFRSEPVISLLDAEKDFPRKLQGEFAAVTADLYIRQEKYPSAIKYLTKAIALSKSRKKRARYTFVLAQLYEREGELKKASNYYNQSIKLKPPYQMVFNARVKMAALANAGKDTREIKKQLLKMLKDVKNKEYLDQLYYALAQIEEKEGHIPKAIEYLKLSVASSLTNANQKALSYLKLADFYFDVPDYPNAQAYYDSTVSVLPKDYPEYNEILNKKQNLTSLVGYLNTIALEDSLQKLARLSPEEREQAINAIMAKAAENEKNKAAQKEAEKQAAARFTVPNQGIKGQQQAGSWYFYNPAAISQGSSEFLRKWGERKPEDNWRRKNKETVVASEQEGGLPGDSSTANPLLVTQANAASREALIKALPTTPALMEKSNLRIMEAYYNLGSIYKEQLLNNQKSAESFEQLITRYPGNSHELSVYYQLYKVYDLMNDHPKSEYYKNKLLKDHPDSEYAKLIQNPEYIKESQASMNEVEQYYSETYLAYSGGNYQEVIRRRNKADTLYARNKMLPKFDFLGALAVGRTQEIKAFQDALIKVTIKHPRTDVAIAAQQMLDAIKNQQTPDSLKPKAAPVVNYKFDNNAEHYVLVLVSDKKADIAKLKIEISDFNTKYYSADALNISNVMLDTETQLIKVQKFPGGEQAVSYIGTLKDNSPALKKLTPGTFTTLVISAENFILFYKDKNIQAYKEFFDKNYK